jgi:peptidyl-prolyl cis-trans isomerase D
LAPDHIVVLHLKEHKPAAARSLDEVREEIRQELRIESAKAKAKEVGEDLVRRIKAGEDAVAAAAQLKLKWERLGFVTRQDTKGNPEITAAAFHLGPAVDVKPVFDGKSLASGDFAAYGLYAVKEGDPAHADEKTVQSLKNSLAREYGQVVFKNYVDALKENMKITRHPDKL